MKKLLIAVCCVLLWATSVRAEKVRIRFGVLPVLDTLPMEVAVRDGLFAAHGLDVELVRFTSALERDTAMQAGQIDGYFGDLVATHLLIDRGVPMYIALTSWRTSPGHPMFGIALSPANKDKNTSQLRGAKLGLSKSTIMEFLGDRMERNLGVAPDYFSRMEVKKMPIRFQMLMSDQLDAALLPEPLLSLARLQGGGVLAIADNLDLPLTVLCLHRRYFRDGSKTYLAFVAAYGQAVSRLATTPERYRPLMAETCRIPKPLVAKFPVYPYPAPALPTPAELADVQQWMIAKGLLKARIPDAQILPPVVP
ncbi:ABC transporter substrate-binding protein [Pseudodesulfovibrio sp.]|uniref:ABC transporter substrate-binding protein n=1 Tax=Pseudodesulfovibrio sp. TaxID=2035812 RepID=UPI002625951D|nr:ABC transporter substrate-binding protein [Pseudodesulfovibrio sp.]MDD3311490.1 ABC transporter substrate-binding protein [Pseudodesulfovibrio sp.]